MRFHLTYSSSKPNCSIYIATSFRDESGKVRKSIVRNCGKKQDLLQSNPNALIELKQEVERLNIEARDKQLKEQLNANRQAAEQIKKNLLDGSALTGVKPELKCLGYLPLAKLWTDLRLDYKLNYLATQVHQITYPLAEITKVLSLLRILHPASKLKTWRIATRDYLGATPLCLDHIYKSLDILCEHKTDIVSYLNKRITTLIPERQTRICLYDITTYAFESVAQDSLRNFGFSKDKKFNEVQVVMALAADQEGIPLNYSLFPGNQAEGATMIPFVDELQQEYGVEKLVVVADRGLNNKANLDALVKLGHDFVLSSRIRSATDEIKAKALDVAGRQNWEKVDENGEILSGWYKEICLEEDISYKYPKYAYEMPDESAKAYLEARLSHESPGGRKKSVKSCLKRRYIVTFSQERARKDKKDRQRLIDKAKRILAAPSQLKAEYKKGGRAYIDVFVDPKTMRLDEELIAQQELFDGIHVVETSLNDPIEEILEIYHRLWRIESNFRALKSQLRSRPVFLQTEPHIRGHFLVCYLALTLTRILEYKLRQADTPLSIDQIIESLNLIRTTKNEITGFPTILTTTGMTAESDSIFRACGLEQPSDYELPQNYRSKLRIKGNLKKLFTTSTMEEKVEN